MCCARDKCLTCNQQSRDGLPGWKNEWGWFLTCPLLCFNADSHERCGPNWKICQQHIIYSKAVCTVQSRALSQQPMLAETCECSACQQKGFNKHDWKRRLTHLDMAQLQLNTINAVGMVEAHLATAAASLHSVPGSPRSSPGGCLPSHSEQAC